MRIESNAWTSLNANQKRTIVNALHTAAMEYRNCAKSMRDSDLLDVAKNRLAAQFKKQCDECLELVEYLES